MKILVSAAIALILWVGSAVPAIADLDSGETDPNPFGGLDCSCQEKYPARSPEQREEIDRGIRDGLSAWSPRGNQRRRLPQDIRRQLTWTSIASPTH